MQIFAIPMPIGHSPSNLKTPLKQTITLLYRAVVVPGLTAGADNIVIYDNFRPSGGDLRMGN